MDRNEKEALVATLHALFQEVGLVVVVHQERMTVAESNDLRGKVKEVGANFRVTKNRLTRIALKGTPFENLVDQFTGPTAIATHTDPVVLAKVMTDYLKASEKVSLVAAGIGPQVIDDKGLEALAKLPSLDELRAKLIGLLNAPASKLVGIFPAPAQKLVGVLPAPAGKLAGVLQAYAQKGEAA